MTKQSLDPSGIEQVVRDAAKRGFTIVIRQSGYRFQSGDLGTEYVVTDAEDPTRIHWRTPSLYSVRAFLRGSHVGFSRGRVVKRGSITGGGQ